MIEVFDEEKKVEELSEEEEEVATEEEPKPEPEPEPEPVEEVHHQKEELGKTEELDIGSLRKKKPWWKFW